MMIDDDEIFALLTLRLHVCPDNIMNYVMFVKDIAVNQTYCAFHGLQIFWMFCVLGFLILFSFFVSDFVQFLFATDGGGLSIVNLWF